MTIIQLCDWLKKRKLYMSSVLSLELEVLGFFKPITALYVTMIIETIIHGSFPDDSV